MCGCNSNMMVSNNNSGGGLERKTVQNNDDCLVSLEDLRSWDTSQWQNSEISLLKSQINIYYQHCNAYISRLESIRQQYQ